MTVRLSLTFIIFGAVVSEDLACMTEICLYFVMLLFEELRVVVLERESQEGARCWQRHQTGGTLPGPGC